MSAIKLIGGALRRAPAIRSQQARAFASLQLPTDFPTRNTLTLSPTLMASTTSNILQGYEMMVCDMAGTTVEEGGAVYETLRQVMNDDGVEVSVEAMHPWHGAKKEAVLEHFCRGAAATPVKVRDHREGRVLGGAEAQANSELEARINRIADAFIESITAQYFGEDSPVKPIAPALHGYLKSLKAAGIKVALDTGYPPEIQELLVKKLGFDDKSVVDAYISAYTVPEGRPYPYMIHRLMEQQGVMDVRKVVKVGDSVRDIEEGKNAGCGLVVGVLSGADSAADMLAAGADLIADCVTDLPVPLARRETPAFRSPDMS